MDEPTSRLKLLEKLGGKCVKCGQEDKRILHIDHICGQGYLEKEYFVDTEKMYEFYLKYFDEESKYLQVLCVNCNLTKRMDNKEGRGRPNLATFVEMYRRMLVNKENDELNMFCSSYPQFESIRNRLSTRLVRALELEAKRRKINEELAKLAVELPFGFNNHEGPKIVEDLRKIESERKQFITFIKEKEGKDKIYSRTTGELWDFLKKNFGYSIEDTNQFINRMLKDDLIVEIRNGCFQTRS